MQLQIRRLGGIAGIRLRGVLDTSELPAEQAAQVESAVRSLAGRSPSAPPRPDAFRYEIVRAEDPDSTPLLLDEHDLPAELAGPVKEAAQAGEIEGPGG